MKVTFTAEATPAEVAELVTYTLDGLAGFLSGFTLPDSLTVPEAPAPPESGGEKATETNPAPVDVLDFRAELRRKIEETNTQLRDLFVDGVTRIFDQHSELERIAWQQYTDYFNDGEPCEFSVRTQFVNAISFEDYDEEWGYSGDVLPEVQAVLDTPWQDNKQRIAGAKLYERPGYAMAKAFLEQFTNDDYRYMFGDHVEILVERDETGKAKVEVTEYTQHD